MKDCKDIVQEIFRLCDESIDACKNSNSAIDSYLSGRAVLAKEIIAIINSPKREKERKDKRNYYAKTQYVSHLYGKRMWEEREDEIVLSHEMSDREISSLLKRSMSAIQNRRSKLKKGIKEIC